VNTIIIPVVENESYLLLVSSRGLCVLCLFIVIKLNGYVGPIVVLGAICGIIVVVGLSNLLFPYTYKLLHHSSTSLKRWINNFPLKQKYLRRKYGALRFLRFYAGFQGVRFFMFEQSTTLEAMQSILEPTIDLLIGYSDQDIKLLFANGA